MSSRPERAIQKRVRPGLPLQGENVSVSFSEGVALGYDGSGRWPVGILILPLELSRLRFIIVEFHVRTPDQPLALAPQVLPARRPVPRFRRIDHRRFARRRDGRLSLLRTPVVARFVRQCSHDSVPRRVRTMTKCSDKPF